MEFLRLKQMTILTAALVLAAAFGSAAIRTFFTQ